TDVSISFLGILRSPAMSASSRMLKFADKDIEADFSGCAGGVRRGRIDRSGMLEVSMWLFQGEFP
ncbi:MAG: hypothetical protein DME65_15175, partial [Verrucomicrobia bacterium]